MEQTYPVIDLYETVQGAGPMFGTPIVLIRTGIPDKMDYIYLAPKRPVDQVYLTAYQILTKMEGFKPKILFFAGEDPFTLRLKPLLSLLRIAGYTLWADTTGVFVGDYSDFDYISLGPKPGFYVSPHLFALRTIGDVRFYWDCIEREKWEGCIYEHLEYIPDKIPIFLYPKRLELDCITGLIHFVINHPRFRLDIPLYRTLPWFDKELNSGKECSICTIQDRK